MAGSEPGPDETLDAIGEGRVRVFQRRDGYRFNLDAVLLAGFAVRGLERERPLDVVDLGTGSGVAGLLVASWRPAWRVRGVEVQPGLAERARRSAALNGLPFEVVEADWRTLAEERTADVVMANPPYFLPETMRVPADEERATARIEQRGGIASLAKAAKRLVRPRGTVRWIHVAQRLPAVLAALEGEGLRPVALRFVHPRADEPAHAVLVEARPDSKSPLTVDAPLVVHAGDGFTPEVARLLSREGV